VIQVIRESDFIVLGPGSWFTSVIPHLLVPELADALIESPAKRILTLNLMPADETVGYSASQHLEILAEHAPRLRLDTIIADDAFARDDRHLAAYAESLGARVLLADLAMRDGTPRHDPLRLGSIYAEVMGATLRPGDLIARYAGDRFLCLFPNCTADHAASAMERVRESLVLELALHELDPFTASVGEMYSPTANSAMIRTKLTSHTTATPIGKTTSTRGNDSRSRAMNRKPLKNTKMSPMPS
jgi:hypothetical protein